MNTMIQALMEMYPANTDGLWMLQPFAMMVRRDSVDSVSGRNQLIRRRTVCIPWTGQMIPDTEQTSQGRMPDVLISVLIS